jgi:Eukaryotic cytochrome b561
LITQGVLILQPTHTPAQKKLGTYIHAGLIDVGLFSLIAGLVIIEVTKFGHGGIHFLSAHAILGLTTYIFLFIQGAVGVTQFFVPQLYGGVDKAKKIYKYHRLSGYVLLALAFATVAAATQTDYNKGTLHIQLWAVLVAEVLTLSGLYARIKKEKLGL